MNKSTANGKPYFFNENPEEQEGEMFITSFQDKKYEVSNLGRIRRLKKSGCKVSSPFCTTRDPHFKVRMSNKSTHRIKDVVYLSFFGELPEGFQVRHIDGDLYNLNVKNLDKFDKKEYIRQKAKERRDKIKYKGKPYSFTNDLELQENEIFKPVDITDGRYSVSNLGRIKRNDHFWKGKHTQQRILTPSSSSQGAHFRVHLPFNKCKIWYALKDLVYLAFVGKIPKGMMVVMIDKDNYNIKPDNLKLLPKEEVKYYTGKAKRPPIKLPNKISKPLNVSIDINTGEKDLKLLEIKGMKKEGYCLTSAVDGVYSFRLLPKEGDTVKVTIEGSSIKVNSFVVESKDGAKYYLKGVDPMNFFLADELEIIKQS